MTTTTIGRASVAAVTSMLVAMAGSATAADVLPGTDVAAMADHAVATLAAAGHQADLTFTLSGALRGTTGETGYESTSTLIVRQTVISPRRAIGTAIQKRAADDKGTPTPPVQIVRFDDRIYMSGGRYDGQTVWVRPMGQPMMNPADPVFRLPRSSQLVGLAAVAGEPGPYVRLRAQIGDFMTRAFARSLHLGKSDLPADQNAATNGTRFENRTIDLVIDPVDGHLVETAAQLDLAVDLNLVSDWGSPITGDQVIKVTSRFVPSRVGAVSASIRRPTSAITLATSRQNENHDAVAQTLLGDASSAMTSAYLKYKTYRVSLKELSNLAPRIKWVTRKAAQARHRQVELVWANDTGYLVAIRSASGKLFTSKGRGDTSVTRNRCTFKGRSCRAWG